MIASHRDAKAKLYAATRASAADMESHVAARAARSRGLPFAALRVVSDAADRTLPPAACVALNPSGGIDLMGWCGRSCAHRNRFGSSAHRVGSGDRVRDPIPLPPPARWRICLCEISASLRSTWDENTNCAGRCRSSGISGAIGPSVLTPLSITPSAGQRARHAVDDGGGFESAVHHAVRAFLVLPTPYLFPVGFLHQLAKRRRNLRPEDSRASASQRQSGWDCPRAYSDRSDFRRESRGTWRLADRPFSAAVAAWKIFTEESSSVAIEKMLLVRSALISIAGRNRHAIEPDRLHFVEEGGNPLGLGIAEQRAIDADAKALRFRSLIASTAFSYVPSRQTDLSCIALSPSRWIDQVKSRCGRN